MFDVMELAHFILRRCTNRGVAISNLHLQKILYFLQKEFLKRTGFPLFSDEIEAWRYGPVVRRVYNFYCIYGADPIFVYDNATINTLEQSSLNIIDQQSLKNPWQLVNETHKKNGAWDRVYQGGIGEWQVIPRSWIVEDE